MNVGTPMRRKPLGEHLEGDRLARAGGAGNQPVAVGETRQQAELAPVVGAREAERLNHRVMLSQAAAA